MPDCWDPFPTHQVSKFWVSHVVEAGSGTQQSNILQISTLRRIFTSQESNLNILIQFLLIFFCHEKLLDDQMEPVGALGLTLSSPSLDQHQGFQSQDPFIRSQNGTSGQHLRKWVSALTDWDWPATPSHVKKKKVKNYLIGKMNWGNYWINKKDKCKNSCQSLDDLASAPLHRGALLIYSVQLPEEWMLQMHSASSST